MWDELNSRIGEFPLLPQAARGYLLDSRFDGKTLLLTGCTGFVGGWVLAAIAWRNAQAASPLRVIGVSRQPASPGPSWFSALAGDVRSLPPPPPVDYVLHGALSSEAQPVEGEDSLLPTSVAGTRWSLSGLKADGGGVVLSSGAALSSEGAYARAVRGAEKVAAAAEASGLRVTVARIYTVLGAGYRRHSHLAHVSILNAVYRGEPVLLRGDGEAVRGYLYGADLAVWLLRLLVEGTGGAPIDVGSDSCCTIAEFTAAALRAANRNPNDFQRGSEPPPPGRIRYLPKIGERHVALGLAVWTPLEKALCQMRPPRQPPTRVRVSVAIPTRNRQAFLSRCLRSAMAAAGPNDEIIVSDNASTDETISGITSLQDPRIRLLTQRENLGMVGNWNACLAAARGEAFLLLSDDDLLKPHAIERLWSTLNEKNAAIVYGRVRVIDAADQERTMGHLGPEFESVATFLDGWFHSKRSIYPCATILRRSELVAAGGYHDRYGPFADVGAWLSACCHQPSRGVAFISDVLASYRVHDSAVSNSSQLAIDVQGLERIEGDHADILGEGGRQGVARLRAHFLASAFRRRSAANPLPILAYLFLCSRHLNLIQQRFFFEPYLRQATIMAFPGWHEARKLTAATKS
jgi:nucleoside-diphosphate-sugar epimerase